MDYQTISVRRDGAVAWLTLDRPDSLNGFTTELCADLLLAFEKAHLDDGVADRAGDGQRAAAVGDADTAALDSGAAVELFELAAFVDRATETKRKRSGPQRGVLIGQSAAEQLVGLGSPDRRKAVSARSRFSSDGCRK